MFTRSLYTSATLAFLFTSQSVMANPASTYGPVNLGQTLWDIAIEIQPDNSVSTSQLVYSLYDLNPTAFESSNMNLLKAGVRLTLPDKDKILELSQQQAKARLVEHFQAFEVLRGGASNLKKAKANKLKYQKKVNKLQRKLGKSRHKSSAWNKTYRQLVQAKKQYKKWGARASDLRESLVAQALTTKPESTPPPPTGTKPSSENTPKSTSDKALDSVTADSRETFNTEIKNDVVIQKSPIIQSDLTAINQRIKKLQITMHTLIDAKKKETNQYQKETRLLRAKLEESNRKLQERIKNQEDSLQRFNVLEAELGKKEKVILKLRSTLRVAAEAMKKQQIENNALKQKLEAFDTNVASIKSSPKLELQVVGSGGDNVSVLKDESSVIDSTPTGNTKTAVSVAATSAVTNVVSSMKNANEVTPEVAAENSKQVKPTTEQTSAATIKPTAANKPMVIESIPQNKLTEVQTLSRSEKRKIRMEQVNQNNTSLTSLSYWTQLIKQNLLIMSAALSIFLILLLGYMMLKSRRMASRARAKELLEINKRDEDIDVNAGVDLSNETMAGFVKSATDMHRGTVSHINSKKVNQL